MLTSNIRKLVRKICGSSAMAIPPRPPMRLSLEALEDRTLPSASSVFEASPPASSSAAAITSFMDSMMERQVQAIATIVQYANNIWNMLGQEMVQEVASFEQQMDRILGISPNTQAQPSNSSVTQSDSGTAKSYASGSGSGSGTASTHEINSPQGRTEAKPLTSGSGSGSPAFSSGSATVSGYVWLDNNGDGYWDNNEKGYMGDTVNLWVDNNGTWVQDGGGVTTTSGGFYTFGAVSLPNPGGNNQFEVQVGLPVYFEATKEGGDSQINGQGYSQPFDLTAGGQVQITGGLCSMNVNTLADDPYGPSQPNTVTLRDAIETGNNDGPPAPQITFIDNQTGEYLSGTISLQAALPAIEESYNIDGPGAALLTVNGNANAGFILDAGKTDTLSGATLSGFKSNSGGGVMNLGNLTLKNDTIKSDQATAGDGGGVDNAKGATLTIENTSITGNSATAGMGGGVANSGKLFTDLGTQISGTNSAQYGGGIANAGSNAIAQLGPGTYISGNTASPQGGVGGYGGGIYNSAGKLTMGNTTPSQVGNAIYKNSAISGGGLYVVSGAVTISEGVTIYKNQATNGAGGGVYIAGGTVKISGGSIYGNTTTAFGGGIYTKGGTLTLTSEYIGSTNKNNGNQAKMGKGGGMYLAIGSTTNFVNNVTVGGNTAKTANGVYVQNPGNGPGNAIVQANGKVVNPLQLKLVLTDNDDPGGTPVTGA
jgi:hypothetical protein